MQGQSLRTCLRASVGFAVASVLLVGPMLLVAHAADTQRKSAAQRHQHAKSLVDEALHREIYGAKDQRNALLSEALAEVDSYAPARWHQGFVREHKRWVRFDELPQMQADYRLLAAYQARRSNSDRCAHAHPR